METWRLRTPNEWERAGHWADVLMWRNHIYNIVINAFKNVAEVAPQLHQVPRCCCLALPCIGHSVTMRVQACQPPHLPCATITCLIASGCLRRRGDHPQNSLDCLRVTPCDTISRKCNCQHNNVCPPCSWDTATRHGP
jgi:hypothetical protein